mmetsp:Transcript_4064/g.7827  ORF Transcript_4064/g.7827 Transcript_4064/m.7827 type:complete len:83 (+) Transcript_4064:2944-3192(+)
MVYPEASSWGWDGREAILVRGLGQQPLLFLISSPSDCFCFFSNWATLTSSLIDWAIAKLTSLALSLSSAHGFSITFMDVSLI